MDSSTYQIPINIVSVAKEVIICVCIISYPSIKHGLISFIIGMWFAYCAHYQSHMERNIFSICHHYHHENNNLFSHVIQLILEYLYLVVTIALLDYCNINPLHFWTILFFYFFYTTVHNINYGHFHINRIHEYHHQDVYSNIGPDIFDILHDTKKIASEENYIENTDHYIPNIIIGTIIIMILKYLYSKDAYKNNMYIIFYYISIISLIIFICSSCWLMYQEKDKTSMFKIPVFWPGMSNPTEPTETTETTEITETTETTETIEKL